jgi:methylmalonyl-CoA mutase C-terminal domain/subunit
MELLREKGLQDVRVILGGIIPDADLPGLKSLGVAAVFRPGTPMRDIIAFISSQTAANAGGVTRR